MTPLEQFLRGIFFPGHDSSQIKYRREKYDAMKHSIHRERIKLYNI